MCRKRSFGTGGRGRRPASPAVCRIPCLILWFAYVESVCTCRAPNSPGGLNGRIASVIASLFSSSRPPPQRRDVAALSRRARGIVRPRPRGDIARLPQRGTLRPNWLASPNSSNGAPSLSGPGVYSRERTYSAVCSICRESSPPRSSSLVVKRFLPSEYSFCSYQDFFHSHPRR